MSTDQPGTQQTAEQASNGIQQIVEQSNTQPNQVASQVQPNAATEYTPEQVAQWRTQAEEADKYRKQYENLLPEYTKSRQYIAQQLGLQQNQQAHDPYAELVAMAEKEGFDKDSARAVAKMADMIAQSRTNSALQQFQYQNAGNQLPLVMQQAYGIAPAALQNPKVQEALRNELNEAITSGQFNLLNPEYAANRAKIIAFDQGLFVPGAQQQQAQQTNGNTQTNMTGMWGIPPGHSGQPRQETQKALSPLAQQVTEDLQARYKGAQIK